MLEGHPLTDCQQPIRRVYVKECDPESLAGALHQQWIPHRLGRRDEQKTPHSIGECLESPDVTPFDPSR